MDLNGNGSCGDAANEIIVYAHDTVNQRITREAWTCSGAPASGGVQSFLGAAAGEVKMVRVVNGDAGVAIPLFRYFNSAGTDITEQPSWSDRPDPANRDHPRRGQRER